MGGEEVESWSNCGSLTLEEPIKIKRYEEVRVQFFDENGEFHDENFSRRQCSLTIQHEIDHNLGILITERA